MALLCLAGDEILGDSSVKLTVSVQRCVMNLSRCPSLRELLDFERNAYNDLLRKSKRISHDLKITNAKIKKSRRLIQSLKRQRWYLVAKLKRMEYDSVKLKASIDQFNERNQVRFS